MKQPPFSSWLKVQFRLNQCAVVFFSLASFSFVFASTVPIRIQCRSLLSPIEESILGEGEHARARLVVDARGRKYVEKIYFSHAVDQVAGDFAGLRFLWDNAEEFPFAVAKPLSCGLDRLNMDYVPGVNLEKLLSMDSASQDEKAALRSIFLKKLGLALQYFEQRCFEVQMRSQQDGFGRAKLKIPHALRATCDRQERFLEFIIKSDNIIVDLATRRMTLIDPY